MLRHQYYIVGALNNDQKKFNEFDKALKAYPEFYYDKMLVEDKDIKGYRSLGVVLKKVKDVVVK
ncbi:MAG: hypothetical protein IIY33_02545 [Erysipelotrichaceae bacterium]|nr:hypothetical protein [Erysipelotrichaceae bacterium]